MSNTDLWNAVERTDPNHVKAITGKSYQGTSPKPHYLVKKATETFGPCGIGWGFNIVSERIEEGAGGERMHIAHVRVWYKWNGERGEVEHVGGTQFSGTRSSGKPFTDEDAPKKSVTDALVKALSMIGFAGDIFIGRYDDSKYVSELRAEFSDEPSKPSTPSPKTSESKQKTVAQLKADYERLKNEMSQESAGGYAKLVRWVNSESVLADIEGLGRYADDFKREFKEVAALAKEAEEEFGEPAKITAGYLPPDFGHLQPVPDALDEILSQAEEKLNG